MSRWRRVVRRELLAYQEDTGHDVLALSDVYDELLPVVRAEFPGNDHPKAKLRQVLQQLEERDEVARLERGAYRLLDVDGGDVTASTGRSYSATEYETTIGARSIPAAFRRVLLADYGGRCPVSGVDHERLLDVAHVLPWSAHPDRRSDPDNVLVLDRTHHAAFDAALFTLDADMRVRVAPSFETSSRVLAETLLDRAGERVPDSSPAVGDALRQRNRELDWEVPG